MKEKLTVFLCSTYTDLSDEREKILQAIRKLQLQHDSMEFFGARSHKPIETCLQEVQQSDLLVVVVGHRYGSLVPGRDVSFSEAEYIEGYSLGKPCLVYLRSDDTPVLPKFVERDPENLRRLERWKVELSERHTVAQFTDSHDLALQVSADIARTVQDLKYAEAQKEPPKPSSRDSAIAELADIFNSAIDQGLSEDRVLSTIRRAVTSLLTELSSRPPTIFLSYSHEDKRIVSEFADKLKAAGMKVWFDLSEIRWGDSIGERIERGLDSADYMVFFMSPNSLSQKWPRAELDAIMSRQIRGDRGAMVLPVLLENADIPPLLRSIKYLDLRDGNVKRGVSDLIKAIQHHSKKRRDEDQYKENAPKNTPKNADKSRY